LDILTKRDWLINTILGCFRAGYKQCRDHGSGRSHTTRCISVKWYNMSENI